MAIGQTSLDMVTAIIVGDISNLQVRLLFSGSSRVSPSSELTSPFSLQWRGLAQGVISSPNIM